MEAHSPVVSLTVVAGRVLSIDILADPERLAQLDLAVPAHRAPDQALLLRERGRP
jgi:hypothetical protein